MQISVNHSNVNASLCSSSLSCASGQPHASRPTLFLFILATIFGDVFVGFNNDFIVLNGSFMLELECNNNVYFVTFIFFVFNTIILKYNLLITWAVAVAVIFVFDKCNTYWSILYGLCLPYQKSNVFFPIH